MLRIRLRVRQALEGQMGRVNFLINVRKFELK